MELCAKVECTTKPNWLELPIDLTKNILQRLDTVDIVTSARNVCPLWWKVCKDPLMWRTIPMIRRVSPFDLRCLEKICRCAIDLSCGHLEEITIESFGSDDLLKHIAHRASRLRRLQLFCCKEISDKGLIDFVWKFSLLEELDITYNRNLSKYSLETIGANCPLLKSLNLCKLFSFCCNESDDEVFAIAKTMPGLCHLKLSGILLNNFGLLSILHGCPHLDSLDLQDSLCLPLTEDLRERCHEQIKVFQLPNNYELPLNFLYDIIVDKRKEYNELCGDGSNIDRCGDNSTFVTYPGDDYIDRRCSDNITFVDTYAGGGNSTFVDTYAGGDYIDRRCGDNITFVDTYAGGDKRTFVDTYAGGDNSTFVDTYAGDDTYYYYY